MKSKVSIELEPCEISAGVWGQRVRVAMDSAELNSYMSNQEFHSLAGIRGAHWDERRSIKAGRTASQPTYWAVSSDGSLSILVGEEDETWDVCLYLPPQCVDQLASLVSNHAQQVAQEGRALKPRAS
jgi:hypothetical protein